MPQQEQAMGKYILVVDDDPDILGIVGEVLTNERYRVQTSLNGACLQRMESDPPDLILLDVLLPGEDGRGLCREVKGREQTRHIPVILFSAHVAAESVRASCGADDFLAKPFRMRELLEIVARRITAR
jgi:CheY-like chemotaxis protein